MSEKNTDAMETVDQAVQEQAAPGTYVHTFSKPVLYEGKTYDKLTFRFDQLTGGDSLDVEAELMSRNHAVVVKSVDSEYLIRMCARVYEEHVGFDIFRLMPIRDYNRITTYSRRFFS